MSRSITTSVRLPPELKNQLEQAAHAMHHGKNWKTDKERNRAFRPCY